MRSVRGAVPDSAPPVLTAGDLRLRAVQQRRLPRDEDWSVGASGSCVRACRPFVLLGAHHVHATSSPATLESFESVMQSGHFTRWSVSSSSRLTTLYPSASSTSRQSVFLLQVWLPARAVRANPASA